MTMNVETTSTIVFRDPPPARSLRGNSPNKVEAFLRAIAWNKGNWAVLRTGLKQGNAHALASQYRKKYEHAQFVARREDDGSYSIFARVMYV